MKVTTLEEFIAAVRGVVNEWTLPGAEWYPAPWFRGHGDAKWELIPSHFRLHLRSGGVGSDWYNEYTLLSEFKCRAPYYLRSALLPRDDWEWLFLMQHFSLPTRLLDWTESALIALHFALRDNHGVSDASVWMLNPWWLNKHVLGEHDIPYSGDPRVSRWAPVQVEQNELYPVAIKPIHATSRITAQRGYFTIHGGNRFGLHQIAASAASNRELCELTIPIKCVNPMRRDLVLAGISEVTVFPEVEGLCREMKDWFYNR